MGRSSGDRRHICGSANGSGPSQDEPDLKMTLDRNIVNRDNSDVVNIRGTIEKWSIDVQYTQ